MRGNVNTKLGYRWKDGHTHKGNSFSFDVLGYGTFICHFASLDVFIDKKVFSSLEKPKTGFAKYPNFLHISFILSDFLYRSFPDKQLDLE